MTETEAPPPPPSHLSQPLLTLGVSGGNQRLLGLVNEKHRALHDVTSRVQHGGCSLWVCGGGRNPAGRLGQSFQGLGRLSGCYSCTHREQTSGKSGAMEAELWLFVTTASLSVLSEESEHLLPHSHHHWDQIQTFGKPRAV